MWRRCCAIPISLSITSPVADRSTGMARRSGVARPGPSLSTSGTGRSCCVEAATQHEMPRSARTCRVAAAAQALRTVIDLAVTDGRTAQLLLAATGRRGLPKGFSVL